MFSYTVILIKVCLLLGISSYVFGLLLKREDRRWIQGKPLWIITLAFPVALVLPNIWILLGLLVVLLPMVARDRGEAAALYVVALLALPSLQAPVSLGSMWILSLSTYHCLTIGLLIASFTLRGARRSGRASFDIAIFLLITLNLIASARGLNATSTLREVVGVLLSYALPYWAVRRSVTKVEDLGRLLLALCFAGTVMSVIAFYEAKSFWPIYEILSMHYGIPPPLSQALKVRAGLMRGNATFPESTSFSWLLAICFVATLVLRDRFRSRTHWYVALVAIVAGLLATQARGGWIAAALGIVLIDVYWRRWSAAGTKLTVFGALYAALSMLSRGNGILSETMGTTGAGAGTVDYRQELFRRGMQEIAKHPWTGTDLANAMARLEDMRQGEGIIDFVNAYVYYGLTAGVFGALALAFVFAWTAASALKLHRRSSTTMLPAEVGAIGFSVCILSAIFAATSGFANGITTFFVILLALIQAARTLRPSAGTRPEMRASAASSPTGRAPVGTVSAIQ